jgi:hypothetical protein
VINEGQINAVPINSAAAEAGNVVDVVEGLNAEFTELLGGTMIEDTLETAVLNDSIEQARVFTVVESAILGEVFVTVTAADLTETAVLNDSLDSVKEAVADVVETARLNDAAEHQVLVRTDFADSAIVLDTLDYGNTIVDVLDVAQVGDSADKLVTVRELVVETGQLDDLLLVSVFEDLVDGGFVSETLTITPLIVVDTSETAVLDDLLIDVSIARSDVVETAVLNDILGTVLLAVTDVSDEAYIYEAIYSPSGVDGSTGIGMDNVWTCSATGWAMSRHTGMDVTSRTGAYAVGPSGLYSVDTTYADSRFETGHLHFGAAIKKRVPYLYVLGNSDETLNVDVTAELAGVRGTYSYTAKEDTTTTGTTVRVDVGKRLTSSYFKFGFDSTGRSEIFGCEAVVAPTQRRI